MDTNSTDVVTDDPGAVYLTALRGNLDDFFLVSNGIIICLMQSGFACLEAGATRAKNVTNIVLKNLMDVFICGLFYWLFGFAFAYGEGNNFVGYTHFAGHLLPQSRLAFWFFQFTFAATAATIVSGAVAERCAFKSYLVYSAAITGFIYPIVTHWTWTPGGWLASRGYVDFAGSGVVHLLGGTCALVGAVVLGPRHKRFPDGEMPGHSTPLVGLGAMLLIVGFISFNSGSQGSLTNVGDNVNFSAAATSTIMGGTGGSFIVLIVKKLTGDRVWSFSMTINGSLAGMVSICAGCNQMQLWSSFVTGLFAGIAYMLLQKAVLQLKIDDPLEAIAVHCGGGFWGLFGASIFDNKGLILTDLSPESVNTTLYRFVGALAIIAWAGGCATIVFISLKVLGILRVTVEEEILGLDVTMHKEPAYPVDAMAKTLSRSSLHRPATAQQFNNMAFVDTEGFQGHRFQNENQSREKS